MTSFSGFKFRLSGPTGRCAATNRVLPPGEVYMALLCDARDDDGWVRHDFSLDAWRDGARPDAPIIAAWRATMPTGHAASRPKLDEAELLDLFEQLAETTERSQIIFRYVLALVLCRRRVLRYEGTSATPHGPAIIVRPTKPADSPPITVVDPALDEAALTEATEEIGSMLTGKPEAGGS